MNYKSLNLVFCRQLGSYETTLQIVMLSYAVHFYCMPDNVSTLKVGNVVYLSIYTDVHSGYNGR